MFLFLQLKTGVSVKKEEKERKDRQGFAVSHYPFLLDHLKMKKTVGSSNNEHYNFVP